MTGKRIVVTEFIDTDALGELAGFDVVYRPDLADDRAALTGLVADADAIIVRNRTQVDAALVGAAPRLVAVGRLGVGLDNIDLAACKARGIAVFPALGANTVSVAEYVIATAMSLLRGAYGANAAMIAGQWPRAALSEGGEVAGRTMGLLGLGTIGRAVAERAEALGMRIAAFDPHLPADDPIWRTAERVDLEGLLATADVLSLHVPLTEGTRGLIDARAIAAMKESAILINTARGGIVDEAALAAALKAGRLGGAALDVFAVEPLTTAAAAVFEGVPNLILTPHIAGLTGESNVRVSSVTVANVKRALS